MYNIIHVINVLVVVVIPIQDFLRVSGKSMSLNLLLDILLYFVFHPIIFIYRNNY